MKSKKLSVRLKGKPVGILEQTLSGKMVFTYDNDATQAISIGMPIRTQPFNHIQCEAFFGGLLPESETVRKAIGKRFGISYNNSFALLKAIGYDCAGAISFHEMDDPIRIQNLVLLEGKEITEQELYEHIRDLPKNPLFMDLTDINGFEGLRLSLAGVHDKAAVCIINDRIVIPQSGGPTSHILKPAIPLYEGIVENEFFCLKIASRIGLPVPAIEIRQIKDISFLLIERYDRKIQNQFIQRIHQEDFCQALGCVPSKKYQNEGGPGIKNCFDLLKNTLQPAIDRNTMAAALIFNLLIGNMDAHGKNFSLLHLDLSSVGFAPLYDIVCTRVYPSLAPNMAMKIGSKYKFDHILLRDWKQLCIDIDYSYPALKLLIKKQGEAILRAAEIERENLVQMHRNIEIIDKIIKFLQDHIPQTLKRLNDEI